MSENKFVVIEGNIGAGKTSLSCKIANDLNAKLILEQFADNPFLPKFYHDPDKYSFPLELSFLAARYHQLKQEFKYAGHSIIVADYYFMKSLIFAQNTLHNDEYDLYRNIFNIIYNSIPKPNLFVYLHLNTDNLLKNIGKRGRDFEKDITSDYLDKIEKGYFDFFEHNCEFPIVIIDTNRIDFVNNNPDYKNLKDVIMNQSYSSGMHRIQLC